MTAEELGKFRELIKLSELIREVKTAIVKTTYFELAASAREMEKTVEAHMSRMFDNVPLFKQMLSNHHNHQYEKMNSIELLKARIEMLTAIPDYYDVGKALLLQVAEVENGFNKAVKNEIDRFCISANDLWAEVCKGGVKYAVFGPKAYKIVVTPLETIPPGEKTLYITEPGQNPQP